MTNPVDLDDLDKTLDSFVIEPYGDDWLVGWVFEKRDDGDRVLRAIAGLVKSVIKKHGPKGEAA